MILGRALELESDPTRVYSRRNNNVTFQLL
jgi:hypothetical protein